MSKEISGIALSINKLPNAYGIKKSSWNNVTSKFRYGFFGKERDITDSIKYITNGTYLADVYETKYGFLGTQKYVKTGQEMKSGWIFSNIGYFSTRKGFFSEEPFIVCSNCYTGKVFGKISADIAEIIIVKESANSSSPSRSEILEKNYSLWSIRINMKCDKCDKSTVSGDMFGCSEHDYMFSKIS